MRAVTLTADRPILAMSDCEDPTPVAGEVVLRVTGCGICGSDLHVASMLAPEGSILGHEIAGVIEAVGSDVVGEGIRPGALVTARPLVGCGQCDHCRRGRPDHCSSFALIGFDRPGGFAEYTSVAASEIFALPADIGIDDQPLVEPLAVAHRALTRGAVDRKDRALVLGAGPIGLALVAWLRARDIPHIVVSEPSAARRQLALQLGATLALDPLSDDLAQAVLDPDGKAPSVVFESAGRPGLLQEAMRLADVDGRVVVVGICPMTDEYFPWTGIQKELDVRFSIYYERRDFEFAIDALDCGDLDVGPIVTDSTDLEALPEMFASLLHDPDRGKVIVRP